MSSIIQYPLILIPFAISHSIIIFNPNFIEFSQAELMFNSRVETGKNRKMISNFLVDQEFFKVLNYLKIDNYWD